MTLNLGRGAKGILWFNHSRDLAEKWPDAIAAMTQWGRVMTVLREDFLDADVWAAAVNAPEGVDVAPLLGRDKLLLVLTNTRYEIHPEAYPFQAFDATPLSLDWAKAAPAAVVRVGETGVADLPFSLDNGRLTIEAGALEAAGVVVVLQDGATAQAYRDAYAAALAKE